MDDKLRQMEDEMNRYNEQSLSHGFCQVLRGSKSYLIILHILNLFLCKLEMSVQSNKGRMHYSRTGELNKRRIISS